MLFLAALIIAGGVIAVWISGRRKAEAERKLALHKAFYLKGMHDALEAVDAVHREEDAALALAHRSALQDSALKITSPAKSYSTPNRRRALPEATRRHGYWRSPPVDLSGDDQIREALARAHPSIRILFTGWSDAEKATLIEAARAVDFRVMTGSSPFLTLLCCGENPGPVKLEKARNCGAAIISGAQFERIAAYDWPKIPTTQ